MHQKILGLKNLKEAWEVVEAAAEYGEAFHPADTDDSEERAPSKPPQPKDAMTITTDEYPEPQFKGKGKAVEKPVAGEGKAKAKAVSEQAGAKTVAKRTLDADEAEPETSQKKRRKTGKAVPDALTDGGDAPGKDVASPPKKAQKKRKIAEVPPEDKPAAAQEPPAKKKASKPKLPVEPSDRVTRGIGRARGGAAEE
ncbi:hypothetical protein HMN09_00210300 [Mycena chlorophos]|uniref:Uncharacterized protein n=1 Tax=Mycena chlorophos TaxID=658473 RepID=A0A8H6WNF9_MYCCL|nr:hypothetical protein HMN09_00210300 [Mycena chlorophos]